MTVKHVKHEDGRIVAFYGESVGRATVTIAPASAAEPGGAPMPGNGETPSAQRALMQQIDQNLAMGTKALGEGYLTGPVRLNGLKVGDQQAICGLVERSQAEDGILAGKERMFLLDRVCASQVGDDIVTVHVTTPITEKMRSKFTKDQIAFSGILIKSLSDTAKR